MENIKELNKDIAAYKRKLRFWGIAERITRFSLHGLVCHIIGETMRDGSLLNERIRRFRFESSKVGAAKAKRERKARK